MKKTSFFAGVCLLSAGIGIILSMFLPDVLLIGIQALMLVIAGILIICAK